MTDRGARQPVGLLLVLSGVVVAVATGATRGVHLSNLHNGLLGLACTAVGAYVLHRRPGHRAGRLLLATGAVEAVLFLGRQVGLTSSSEDDAWWGWLGAWPVAAGLALTTLSVMVFPDGRLPSRRWRPVAAVVVVAAGACAAVSALWPVEYASTGVRTPHPLDLPGAGPAAAVWDVVAHPLYAALQVLWVVVLAARWRRADRVVRSQIAGVAAAAAGSVLLLLVGLATTGEPAAGVLAAALLPVAAGWAVVHGEQLAGYAALSWLTGARESGRDLPTELARAAADAVGAPGAALWRGDAGRLLPVGTWPLGGAPAASDLPSLLADADLDVRPVGHGGAVRGALVVQRPAGRSLTGRQGRVLDDLAAQASLVLDHLQVLHETALARATADLDHLSPREQQVLALMARGLSNAAICRELHLSVKTVEPLVGSVFAKLGLPQDSSTNRRVLAVLAYHGDGTPRPGS